MLSECRNIAVFSDRLRCGFCPFRSEWLIKPDVHPFHRACERGRGRTCRQRRKAFVRKMTGYSMPDSPSFFARCRDVLEKCFVIFLKRAFQARFFSGIFVKDCISAMIKCIGLCRRSDFYSAVPAVCFLLCFEDMLSAGQMTFPKPFSLGNFFNALLALRNGGLSSLRIVIVSVCQWGKLFCKS